MALAVHPRVRFPAFCVAIALTLGASPGAQEVRPLLGTVTGTVVDTLGMPVRDAQVWLAKPGSAQRIEETTTTNGGNFVLRRVPLDQVIRVWATAPGLTRGHAQLRVAATASAETARIRLWDAGTLGGRVVDPQGAPVPGATVCAPFSARGWAFEPQGETTTDATGAFTLDKIPLGDIAVRAIAPGRVLATTQVYLRDEADVQITLAEGIGVRISVRVEGVTPEIAAKLTVHVLPYEKGSPRIFPTPLVSGRLDDRGEWHVHGLPPLEYRVSVHGEDLVLTPPSQVVGGEEVHHKPVFKLLPLQEITLRGRILGPAGKPVAGTTLTCRDDTWRHRSTARTDDEGRFEMRGPFAPGLDCFFEIADAPFVLSPQLNPGERDPLGLHATSATISSVLRTDAEYALQARPAAEVRGRLTARDGAPLRFHPVAITEGDADQVARRTSCARTTTDRSGSFAFPRLRAVAGSFRVETSGPEGAGQSELFALREGRAITVTVLCDPSSSVAGVLLDAVGKPLAGARVWLHGYPGGEVYTDRQGRFRHLGVEPGRHKLQVLVVGGTRVDLAEGGDLFEVKPGESVERRLRIQ